MIVYIWMMHLCNYWFFFILWYLFEIYFRIAMTTHCASRYQKVLKQIAPRICIVEEAAEVNRTINK